MKSGKEGISTTRQDTSDVRFWGGTSKGRTANFAHVSGDKMGIEEFNVNFVFSQLLCEGLGPNTKEGLATSVSLQKRSF